MAEKNFAITPSVSINRSKFLRTSNHKTSFNLGQIIPIYLDEVLPGDTRSIDVASLVRMSTPIAPIMDDIELEIFAFFVPNRIVWDDWKEFMGESPTAGYHAWSGTFPYVATDTPLQNSLGSYFGIGQFSSSSSDIINLSALPLRGYLAIYNRWFRDQNVEGPAFVDTSDGQDACTNPGGASYTYYSLPLNAYKKSDYFTRALPYAQKSLPVSLPLGTTAPVVTSNLWSAKAGAEALRWANASDGTQVVVDRYLGVESVLGQTYGVGNPSPSDFDSKVIPGNLVADLSKATAATINQLREAFQLQKLLEKDALYGTRYWELLYGHFGVRSPDATLQDPEYLGGTKFMINVDQVLSTAGYAAGDTTTVGAPGANSVTGNKGSLFTKSFVEHGFIHIYAVARQRQHTYGQGINRMWRRFDRYDYYWPEFANLGAMEIKDWEIMPKFDASHDLVEGTFGYQEAWADYRYKPSIVSGILNPAVSGSLNFWTLSDKYTTTPTLGTDFLKETRSNLVRALTTGVSGPDFIADFYFRDVAVRPMPLYSIPGLIDHH